RPTPPAAPVKTAMKEAANEATVRPANKSRPISDVPKISMLISKCEPAHTERGKSMPCPPSQAVGQSVGPADAAKAPAPTIRTTTRYHEEVSGPPPPRRLHRLAGGGGPLLPAVLRLRAAPVRQLGCAGCHVLRVRLARLLKQCGRREAGRMPSGKASPS